MNGLSKRSVVTAMKEAPLALPLERTMTFRALGLLVVMTFCAWASLIVSCFLIWLSIASDRWSTCEVRGVLLRGAECHWRLVTPLGIVFALTAVFSLLLLRTGRKIARARALGGPSLRIDGANFWCEQLAEPIRFADVVQVQLVSDRLAVPREVVLFLSSPPRLNYGRQQKRHCWLGWQPAFVFRPIGYLGQPTLAQFVASTVAKHAQVSIIRL